MTREEAAELLGTTPEATTGEVRRRFHELYSEMLVRLTNAPTPALRSTYEANLGELKAACRILSPGYDEAHDRDLPTSQPLAAQLVAPIAPVAPLTEAPPKRPGLSWWALPLAILGVYALALVTMRVGRSAEPAAAAPAQIRVTPPSQVPAVPRSGRPSTEWIGSRSTPKPRREPERTAEESPTAEAAVPVTAAPRYETRTTMEPVTSYVSETVPEHPNGDTEQVVERLHDYDLYHDPPDPAADGVLHPGNNCRRVACEHYGRCVHGQPNRCLVCGEGPFTQHAFDWAPCPHPRPCTHQAACSHTRVESHTVPCRHLVTRQRAVTEMRAVEHVVEVSR